MKFKEVQEKNSGELDPLEAKLRKELADLRLKAFGGQLVQTSQLGAHRKDIARVLTARKTKATKMRAGGD